jgi:hypothetical protein
MTLPISKESLHFQNVALNIANTVIVAIAPPVKTVFLGIEAYELVSDMMSGKSLYQDVFTSLVDMEPKEYCMSKLGSRYAMVAESLVFTSLSSYYLSSHYQSSKCPSLPLIAVGNAALENGIAAAKYKICLHESQSYVDSSDSTIKVEVMGQNSCTDNGNNLCQDIEA